MNYSVNYFIRSIVLVLPISTSLLSCSEQQNIKGNPTYLYQNTLPLRDLKMPPNIRFSSPIKIKTIPERNQLLKQKKPNAYFSNYVRDEDLDIRPPKEIVILYPISRGIFLNNKVLLTIKNHNNYIWKQIVKIINFYDIPIIAMNNKSQQLTTGWVASNDYYSKNQYLSRYQITLDTKKHSRAPTLVISLLDIKLNMQQEQNNNVITPQQIQTVIVEMSNNIIIELNKISST